MEFCKFIKFNKIDIVIIEQELKAHQVQQISRYTRNSEYTGGIGPPGINEINQSHLYSVEGNTVSINGSNVQATSSAPCDEGDTVIDGNYAVTSFAGVLLKHHS